MKRLEMSKLFLQCAKAARQDKARLASICNPPPLIEALTFKAAGARWNGYQLEVWREPSAGIRQPRERFGGSETVAPKQEKLVNGIAGAAVQQKGNEERARELGIRQPERV